MRTYLTSGTTLVAKENAAILGSSLNGIQKTIITGSTVKDNETVYQIAGFKNLLSEVTLMLYFNIK